MHLTVGIVVRPGRAAPSETAAESGVVPQPDEHESPIIGRVSLHLELEGRPAVAALRVRAGAGGNDSEDGDANREPRFRAQEAPQSQGRLPSLSRICRVFSASSVASRSSSLAYFAGSMLSFSSFNPSIRRSRSRRST